MHAHTHQLTMGLAFFLGAIHALEPGHGKTAMLVYLADQRRSIIHPLLMGISSATSHSLSLVGIAFLVHAAHFAVTGQAGNASDSAQFWLRAISAAVVMGVGLWMLAAARRAQPASSCSCGGHHDDEHHHDSKPEPVEDTNRTAGYSASVLLGAAFGMLPCPSAVAAYLTGMAHGSPTEAYASIGLFACGIATSLTAVGIVVQRFGSRLLNGTNRLSQLPWATVRAVVVLLVGAASGLGLFLW